MIAIQSRVPYCTTALTHSLEMVLYPNAEILKKTKQQNINKHLESKTIFILMPVGPQTLSLFTEMPGDSTAQENLAIVTLNRRFKGLLEVLRLKA